MSDMLNPPASLLVKLVSIAVHSEELRSPDGHDLDRVALEAAYDGEVREWIDAMTAAGLAPVKRKS
jgi:hypothetical protein